MISRKLTINLRTVHRLFAPSHARSFTLTKMSWMDSWSRPPKHAQFPPPLYLTSPGGVEVPYCHTCGRVISTRRKNVGGKNKKDTSEGQQGITVKYCSERCRRVKPGKLDRKVEDAFVAVLEGDVEGWKEKYDVEAGSDGGEMEKMKKGRVKGERRVIAWCGEVETLVFGSRVEPGKTAGRRRNRAPRGVVETGEWRSVDMEERSEGDVEGGSEMDSYDSDDMLEGVGGVQLAGQEVDRDHVYFGAGKRRPSQSKAEVNGSVGGEKGWAEKIEETEEMAKKRLEGQRRAEEKELVKRAARRGVVFGFLGASDEKRGVVSSVGKRKKGDRKSMEEVVEGDVEVRRKCEAVVTKAAVVVEPSFVKGDWGIRWREE